MPVLPATLTVRRACIPAALSCITTLWLAPVARGQVTSPSDSAAIPTRVSPGLAFLDATIPVGARVLYAPPQDRPLAVEHSEWFYRRQAVHRYASYLTLPLFVTQYLAGEELLKNGDSAASWAHDVHPMLAAGIWGLFAVNTVTGAWNWWDTRAEPAGRTRRTLHAALMLAADIGFATIGEAENEHEGGFGAENDGQFDHRRHAIISMSIATAGYLLMALPFWKD